MTPEREKSCNPGDLVAELTGENKLLARRLERERRIRHEAENIAERGLRDLYQKQRDLEFLSTITMMANEADSVSEVLSSALEYVCRFTGWPAAHAYIIGGEGADRRMRPTSIWYHDPDLDISELRSATRELVFDCGVGLPGQVWETGAPVWFDDLATCDNFLRRDSAVRSGLRVAFSAPIMVRSEVVGSLEFFGSNPMPENDALLGLTAKASTQLGRTMERERHETLLAGVAVENARLYEQSRERLAWIEATRDIATELLGGDDPARVFQLVADQSLRLTQADAVLVAVPHNTEPHDSELAASEVDELVVVASAGSARRGADTAPTVLPVSIFGAVLADRTPRLLPELTGVALIPGAGPAMVLPLRTTKTVAGVVVLLRRTGEAHFGDNQLDMMAAFADQAALAWQLANTQRRMRELDVIADRDRIARDLHDHVIQRLFAAGLSLQGANQIVRSPQVRTRLDDVVDELQSVIQEIRTTIFDLHGGSPGTTRLRQRLDQVIAAFAGSGPRTTLQFIGPLSVVEPPLADHAEAVVREAVSNVVRHAGATALTVTVRVEDDFSVEVLDDGCGMPANATPSGLTNLRVRAEEVGGQLTVTDAPGGGTLLRWSAPLV
jgi:signal transduction histidine kinase